MMRSYPILWLSASWELFLLLLAIISITLISTIYGDPANSVLNGDFETQIFTFRLYPQMDVIHDGMMSLIPHWQVVYGGVQVLDATEYLPDPTFGGDFIIHLNYMYGAGVMISSPLVTPRKGATYNLTFDIADNPDGGPLYKALRVKILVNNQEADPSIDPYNVSAPVCDSSNFGTLCHVNVVPWPIWVPVYVKFVHSFITASQRRTISWVRVGVTFVGTGEMTQIQFESMTPGSFGALIDNVQVTLMTLVDNGSFENTKSLMVYTNDSWYNIITAPADILTSWTVVNGALKRVGGSIWELSSDNTAYCLELNADEEPGTILSDPFPTIIGSQYVVLYDTAASPEDIPPLDGAIFGCVRSSADGAILAYTTVEVNADGYSRNNIGWETHMMTFEAENTSVVVEFVSRIQGSDGPLLDNVLAYQVVPTGKYKSVPLTYSVAATPPRSSLWITVLAGCTSICTCTSILCTLDYLFLQRRTQDASPLDAPRTRDGARKAIKAQG